VNNTYTKLENRRRSDPTVGSNPTLSANFRFHAISVSLKSRVIENRVADRR
jgi:hypothetical protein